MKKMDRTSFVSVISKNGLYCVQRTLRYAESVTQCMLDTKLNFTTGDSFC